MNRSRPKAEPRPDPGRRAFSRTALGFVLAGCGVLPAMGGVRPPADRIGAALSALGDLAGSAPRESGNVLLTLPTLIEDGAMVPITVSADLPDVREIFVLTDMNPAPVAAQFRIGRGMSPRISVRIKLAESGRVYGAVRTSDGLYWNAAAAEVMLGGCA